ncbi:MAG: hypothetical protein GF398_03290 [Chitinivibrionales bacterium]|nr:hypothetical protein [Chitinivibrionales bacterium]
MNVLNAKRWGMMAWIMVLQVSLCLAIPFPVADDDSYYDVKRDFGATGDGVTDDTYPFLQATFQGARCIYIPNGTYLVADTFNMSFLGYRRPQWVGESRDSTIIKIKDDTPIFSDPANPKKLFFFGGAYGLQEFRRVVRDLTIDVGSGNPGAIGLSFFTANQGEVRNVTIRSSDPNKAGVAGLVIDEGEPGPALISKVHVDGFDYGIRIGVGTRSLTLDSISVVNQRKAGIYKKGGVSCPINHLYSNNTVPAVRFDRGANSLLNSLLEGGGAGDTAVVSNSTTLYVLNTSANGYGTGIWCANSSGGGTVLPDEVDEWSSDPVYSMFGSTDQTLKLPVEIAPEVAIGDQATEWVDAGQYGTNSAAIQQAIDAGKRTVFLSDAFRFDTTVIVRGTVERIISIGEHFQHRGEDSTDYALFRVEDGTAPVVIFDNFEMKHPVSEGPFVEHASDRTVILRTCGHHYIYTNTVGGGKAYIEDCGAGKMEMRDGNRVWIRSFNPEGHNEVRILNDGAHLWVLGMKTEDTGVNIRSINCAHTVLYNAWFCCKGSSPIYQDRYGFESVNSNVTIVNGQNGWASPYGKSYQEKRDADTQTKNGFETVYTGISCPIADAKPRKFSVHDKRKLIFSQKRGTGLRVLLDAEYQVDLVTLSGRIVHSFKGRNPATHFLLHIAPGAYFARVKSRNYAESMRMIVR